MQPSTISPTVKNDRINALDINRGVAVCGILLMNITGFGLYHAYENPTISGGAAGWNLTVWWVNSVFFEGTMRGMFSVLFGAGIILFTSRISNSNPADIIDLFFKRLLWLILFGIIHCYLLLWSGEILYSYGLIGMLAFGFRHLMPRNLIIWCGVFLLAATLWNVSDYFNVRSQQADALAAEAKKSNGDTLTEAEAAAITTWQDLVKDNTPDPKKMEKEIAEKRKGYFSIVMHTVPEHQYMQTMFVYRLGVFDTLAMMLLGMAFLKLGVLQASRSIRFYLIMGLVGYATGVTVNYLETSNIVNHHFEVLAIRTSEMSYQIGRVANMCGHIALIMLFVKSGWLPLLQRALAAVGQMALTNYISQSLICNFIFLGYGLSMYGTLQRYQLYYIVFGVWIFQLIVSPIWLSYFRFGPMEWLWRSLTYWKRQPFLRGDQLLPAHV